jgi:alpha-D-ribose 1-methylphosphonate 5-triphosphate synthase subunit PhnH
LALQVDLGGGFADPVLHAQTVFRTVMDAMARPAILHTLAALPKPPAPLSPTSAAVLVTLADGDTPVWLDAPLAASEAVRKWIAFHCGAAFVADPGDSDFAVVSGFATMPAFELFAQGTQEFPDRSTTVILQCDTLGGGETRTFAGPGIPETAPLAVPGLPPRFDLQCNANHGRFPRGIDVIFAGDGEIVCLPRSARLAAREG